MTASSKQHIRDAFNAATHSYDATADWQKNVGDRLLYYINEIQPNNKTILDLGAGTGYLARHIHKHYPNNQLIALDIAECMLHFSKQHFNNSYFICADAENIALCDKSIDIIVSNMVLHWCASLEKTLQEQYRILRDRGLLIFSILGPHSLGSLKKAWEGIDEYTHVNTFPDPTSIKNSCQTAGFSLLHFEHHEIQKHYENVFELMHHLKATGAKSIMSSKSKGLMGKQKIKQMSEQYQNPLCYEIFTVICQK